MLKKYKSVWIREVGLGSCRYTVSINWRNPRIKYIADTLKEAEDKARELSINRQYKIINCMGEVDKVVF